MKRMPMMNKFIFVITTAVAMIAMTNEALAGFKDNTTVTIGQDYMLGSFGATRNSADTWEHIYMYDQGSTITVVAGDTKFTQKACSTNNLSMMAALRGAASDAYLYVKFSNGGCTSLYVYKGSQYAPKNP